MIIMGPGVGFSWARDTMILFELSGFSLFLSFSWRRHLSVFLCLDGYGSGYNFGGVGIGDGLWWRVLF